MPSGVYVRTVEHKAKLSAAAKKNYEDPEHRAKMSAAIKDRPPVTEETIAKIVAVHYIEDRTHVGWGGYPLSYRDIRQLIRDRDVVCQHCGKNVEQNRQEMCVHHIDEDRTNSDHDNLICLCRSCHMKVHKS